MKETRVVLLVGLVAVVVLALLMGCKGPIGPAGTSEGTISGTVTDSVAGNPVSDVAVATEPVIEGVSVKTDANGKYAATIPIGVYTLTFKKDGFDSATQTVGVIAGRTVAKDVALKPKSPVAVNAGKDQSSSPGGTVSLKATADPIDGSQLTGYKWTQTAGAAAKIQNADSDTATVTLGDAAAYKKELFSTARTLDRFTVQAINPLSLEEAETATFKVAVTTTSGTYNDTVNVTVKLPYKINAGIQNVPTHAVVLLHGKKQDVYDWALTPPQGSKTTLDVASDQNPAFTPDVAGEYTLTERKSGTALKVYAGTWVGVVTGQDAKGQPTYDTHCTVCHNDSTAPNKFAAWAASGHAEILTQNINDPQGHWTISCASCHTVGYDPDANNNGFDEAMAKEGWKVPEHGAVDNWAKMLASYPGTARLANVQCENCHGPQQSAAHTQGSSRISLSSDVCGSCHGEPERHGRFQQWEESGHGNFELAIDESGSASCVRCHTAQGFLAWLKQGDLTKSLQGAKGNATAAELAAMGITKDTVQPQTCVVCHDPHAEGTTSGEPNTATVRIEDNTPMLPAGFAATAVGRGAMCITCHNTRNGAHNDTVGNPPSYSAPHTAAQGDVLMGQNAYFVGVGERGAHSFINDTCATCHMEITPPPKELSYQLSGTNHSFTASTKICSSCHGAFDGGTLEASVEAELHELGKKMGDYLLSKISAQVHIKDYTPHTYAGKSYDLKSADVTVDKANIASVEPTEPHGQQGFLFKFKTPVTFSYSPTGEAAHTMSLAEAEVQLGDITTDGTKALIPLEDPLVKAGWNYFLIEGDGSAGVHNPSFTLEVLKATINALK